MHHEGVLCIEPSLSKTAKYTKIFLKIIEEINDETKRADLVSFVTKEMDL